MRLGTWSRPLLALALATGIGFSMPAAAQDDDENIYDETGVYLTGMAVFGYVTDKSDLESDIEKKFGTRGANVDDSWGLSGRLGYRLHPRVAVEAQFEWLREIKIESKIAGGGKRREQVSLYGVTGNVKGYLLTGRIQPYVVGGVGWGRATLNPDGSGAKSRSDNLIGRVGIGTDLYANQDVALSLEAAYVLGEESELNYVSVGAGLTLRFYAIPD